MAVNAGGCSLASADRKGDMADFFVWVTTRRIREGTLEDLRQAWEPPEPPEGMTRAFEWVGADRRTVVGVSHWDSEESCDRYRSSPAEAERRERMAPYVESEESETYSGRELSIPSR
jgi:hypothetical protein